jgi:ferrochelatase
VFFSAHGVPKSYVEEAGDPYKEEMEECVALIMGELTRRGRWVGCCLRLVCERVDGARRQPAASASEGDPVRFLMLCCFQCCAASIHPNRGNAHTLAYQSRVGPVEWLQPYTDDSIRCARV